MMVTVYILSSLLVGLLAIGRRGGFLFYFAVSIVGSPILGLILLVLATEVIDRDDPRSRPASYRSRYRDDDPCRAKFRGDDPGRVASRGADACRADRT